MKHILRKVASGAVALGSLWGGFWMCYNVCTPWTWCHFPLGITFFVIFIIAALYAIPDKSL